MAAAQGGASVPTAVPVALPTQAVALSPQVQPVPLGLPVQAGAQGLSVQAEPPRVAPRDSPELTTLMKSMREVSKRAALQETEEPRTRELPHGREASEELGDMLREALSMYEKAEPRVARDPQWRMAKKAARRLGDEDLEEIFGKTASSYSVARAVNNCLTLNPAVSRDAHAFCLHLRAAVKDLPPAQRMKFRSFIVAATVAAAGAAAAFVAGNRAGRQEMKEMMHATVLPFTTNLLKKNPATEIYPDFSSKDPHLTSVHYDQGDNALRWQEWTQKGIPEGSTFLDDLWRFGKTSALRVRQEILDAAKGKETEKETEKEKKQEQKKEKEEELEDSRDGSGEGAPVKEAPM